MAPSVVDSAVEAVHPQLDSKSHQLTVTFRWRGIADSRTSDRGFRRVD
jgi:hypothetical protein